jgi:hypothetical protein
VDSPFLYLLAADAILLLHAMFVIFVVAGLILILVGKKYSWLWIRNPWFRLAHLLAITVVVIQALMGASCPLTIWEMELRFLAGDKTYSGAFIAYWIETFLYYRAPPWVFTLIYALFGACVGLSWFWVRPRSFFKDKRID